MFNLRMRHDLLTVSAVVFVVVASCFCVVVTARFFQYDEVGYNCEFMSYELGFVLRYVGVGSDVVYVHNSDCSEAHCYLNVFGVVPFESTALIPFLPLFSHGGWVVYRVVEL